MSTWDRPVLLTVLDGFGLSEKTHGNAIAAADTPNLDRLLSSFPSTQLPADGEHVGLLDGGLGGSEVGHMQIGAGRLVPQLPKIISDAIDEGSFFEKDTLHDAIQHADEHDGTLHVMGLCSDKGIHSLISHLYGTLEYAAREGFDQVAIHMFLDGRDTEPRVAERYVRELEERLEDFPGKICTVSGRYYAMDRDLRWERTQQAYDAIVNAEGLTADTTLKAVEKAYERGESDEFVQPTIVEPCPVEDGDAVFIFNFRADRCRQLTRCFIEDRFDGFPVREFDDLFVCSMTQYSDDFDIPVMFKKELVPETLGEALADQGLCQHRIAESEKKAHVTYFFSGRREEPFEGEERTIFPSPRVDVYNKTPEMRAGAITDRVIEVIEDDQPAFILVNLSNCDMVGHTGDFEAAVEAVEVVDRCVGRLYEYCQDSPYLLMITADHGNADEMKDEDGDPLTAHSYNPVPFILAEDMDVEFHDGPALYRIAPAILSLNDSKIPAEMVEPLFREK